MTVIKAGTLAGGNLEGEEHGATISLILDDSEPGHGPRLHRHPYGETWVVIEGTLSFQSGDERLTAGSGDIVIVAPGAAHKFTRPRPLEARLHPRQPHVRHRMARMSPTLDHPHTGHSTDRYEGLELIAVDTRRRLLRVDALEKTPFVGGSE